MICMGAEKEREVKKRKEKKKKEESKVKRKNRLFSVGFLQGQEIRDGEKDISRGEGIAESTSQIF